MPTIVSHALVATVAGQWWRRMPASFWWWTVICAMLPDADVITFSFGIRYEDMFGHRGITHSIAFAVVLGLVAAKANSLEGGRWRLGVLWVWFAAVTMSHGLLDALTNGGRGIAFFAPFSPDRYFFPWRPIQVSPIGAGFFSPRGLRVLASESVWIWLPSAIIAVFARVFRRPT
jgi:inner membrane protein